MENDRKNRPRINLMEHDSTVMIPHLFIALIQMDRRTLRHKFPKHIFERMSWWLCILRNALFFVKTWKHRLYTLSCIVKFMSCCANVLTFIVFSQIFYTEQGKKEESTGSFRDSKAINVEQREILWSLTAPEDFFYQAHFLKSITPNHLFSMIDDFTHTECVPGVESKLNGIYSLLQGIRVLCSGTNNECLFYPYW